MKNEKIPNLSFWRSRRLPVMLQNEMAECGLTCLLMIANYWGHEFDLISLRRRFSVSIKGLTLKSLITISTSLSFQARPLKLNLNDLPKLSLPCILHWNMTHYVVLKHVSKNYVIIHDPAVGERRISLLELSKSFSGIALELTPNQDFEKKREVESFTLRSLMGRVVGLKRGLTQILLLGVAIQICALIGPFYMQWVVDEAILVHDKDLLTVLGCGFILLVFVQAATGAVRTWVTTVLSTNLNLQWLGNTFFHLLSLPLDYFEKRHTGDIVSRFSSIQEVQSSITTNFIEGIIDGVLVISTLILMMIYSLELAFVACISVFLYTILRWIVYRDLREATSEQIIHAAKQQTHFLESVRSVQGIRLFGKIGERHTSWLNSLSHQMNADLRISKLSVSYQSGNTLIFGAERVVIIWMGALAVIAGDFSVGMLFAFISYKDQFSQRIASLIDKVFQFRMLRLHGERIADIILTPIENDLHHEESEIGSINPSIEFRDVTFRYSDNDPVIISSLSFSIAAGESVAFAGASGSGKSTLIKLMLGLLKPSSGEVLVGGVDIQRFGLKNYRKIIGTVMQDDTLFSGSLSENISFFDPEVDLHRVQYCAVTAAIHDEITKMPMGYNTLVGDIGTGLSGGQKQRLLLARALYQNPKILVLDEATSHLDMHNEHLVNEAVRNLHLTRIIVAHRPETIRMAGRVISLSEGKIIHDSGNHQIID